MLKLSKKQIAILFVVFLVAYLVLFCSTWMNKKFGDVALDALLFTLFAPRTTTPIALYLSLSKRLLLSFFCAGASTYFICLICKKWYNGKTLFVIPVGLLVVVVLYFFSAHGYAGIIYYNNPSTFIDEHYVGLAEQEYTFPQNPPNVIFLLLESAENTFNDPLATEPLMPFSRELQTENQTFFFQEQPVGTSWTAGALTGHFFGLPLKLSIGQNRYDQFGVFLPGAYSILDLLSDNSYKMDIVMGGSGEFAGKSTLFSNHAPKSYLHDRDVIIPFFPDGLSELGWWGVQDRDTYEYAKNVISQAASGAQPFFTFIMTVDTHSGQEVYDQNLRPYGDQRDAFVNADRMAGEFIEWLRVQDFFENTLLIVVGDHNYMNNQLGELDLTGAARSPYFALINSRRPFDPQAACQREYCAFDVAPTILEAMGLVLPARRFGLGVSLYSEQLTLIEQYGLEYLNSELSKRSDLYSSFFALP